jgi:methylase of polypeptide subunit release factors
VLVERALGWIRERTAEKPEASLDVLDLCTGTGCIAISLALGMRAIRRPDGTGCRPIRAAAGTLDQAAQLHATQQPVAVPVVRDLASEGRVRATESALSDVVGAERETTATTTRTTTTNAAAHDLATGGATGGATGVATVVATDIVSDAIELARRNAARLAAHIDLRVGDLYGALRDEEGFDLIVSNPPYVTDAEYSELDRNVREYEPASALRGGADGLQFVRAVVAGAERRLRSGGLLLVEIGWKHGDAVRKLGTRAGWRDVEVLRDGDGHERVLVAHRV